MNELIKRAIELATKAHKNQKRANGRNYIEHPREVSYLLEKWNQDEEVIAAGWLHDVVEDCDIKLSTIEENFGERVAILVDGMSWIIKEGKKDMEETYKKFATICKKEPSLIRIKAADMLSNIPMIDIEKRDYIINKSYPRNMKFYIPLLKEVGLKEAASKIEAAFNKYTKEKVKSELDKYFTKEELIKLKQKLI